METPTIFVRRHQNAPVDESVQKNPVIPRLPAELGFDPGKPESPPQVPPAGTDSVGSPPMMGTISIASRSIPVIPAFPVADCRGFDRLIPEIRAEPANGLYLKANPGTSANPRFTPPPLPHLSLDSIILSRKRGSESGA
jgi:hypothetical protein